MNHKERILAAIHHKPVDRFPTDIWATPEVWTMLCNYFCTTDRLVVYDELHIDGIFNVSPNYIGPALKNVDGIHYNEWGMGFRAHNYGTGIYDEQVVYPLEEAETISDLNAYDWPSVDWYDYLPIKESISQHSERAIEVGYTAIFYYHNLLRGLKRSLMDPLEKPKFTSFLIGKISDFFYEYHRRCFDVAKGYIDITQVTDDYGSQTGLLINPKIYERFYYQPMQRAVDLAHAYKIAVFHHDDGDCRLLLPMLVRLGIQILNPIQWRCGNWDLVSIKQQFGEYLCFHGGIDNQQTLPFGSPLQVREEVRHIAHELGKNRTGLIIAPCHNIQSITPIDNILAMYDEAHRV